MNKLVLIASASFAALTAIPASASIDVEVPSNAYITFGGLQWAWAYPLPGDANLLSFQGSLGWRLPTADELASAPLATDFLFAGANVPFLGSDPISGASFQATNGSYAAAGSAGACAAPYFSDGYAHCDFQDGNGQPYGPWYSPGGAGFGDQLFVRAVADVPEPASWALMLIGFGAIGGAMRSRRKVAVSFA